MLKILILIICLISGMAQADIIEVKEGGNPSIQNAIINSNLRKSLVGKNQTFTSVADLCKRKLCICAE